MPINVHASVMVYLLTVAWNLITSCCLILVCINSVQQNRNIGGMEQSGMGGGKAKPKDIEIHRQHIKNRHARLLGL